MFCKNYKIMIKNINISNLIRACVVILALMIVSCDDYLDKAWGLEPDSRLSCQAIVADEDLVIEIPKYTINMVSENH